MSKKLYEVIATDAEGFIVCRFFQTAESESDAIETVKSFYINPGVKYTNIRAEVRE